MDGNTRGVKSRACVRKHVSTQAAHAKTTHGAHKPHNPNEHAELLWAFS